MPQLDPRAEWPEETRALRRFGLALAQDDRLASDAHSIAALVEALINRALLAARNGEGPRDVSPRSRLFSLFIRFHRRHVRLQAVASEMEELVSDHLFSAHRDAGTGPAIVRAMRALPFELREALLLVVVERLSYVEAAAALEIPLVTLIDRLVRGRESLTAELSHRPRGASPGRGPSGPHLRLVK